MSIIRALASAGMVPLSASNGGFISSVGTGTVTAGPGSVTATGGRAPYTYAAAVQTGDTPAILDGATSTPSVRMTGVTSLSVFSGTIRVTVTDAVGRTATTDISWQIQGAA